MATSGFRQAKVPITIIVDEWIERTVQLAPTGAGQRPQNKAARQSFLRAFRRAEKTLALVVAKRQSVILSEFVGSLTRSRAKLATGLRLRQVRMVRFRNRCQVIIQFSWYASQHPYR